MKHNEANNLSKRKKSTTEMKTTAISKKAKKSKGIIKASQICRKNKAKKNVNIESVARDTIAETIAFVIQGQLTSIESIPLTVSNIRTKNVVAREQRKRCCKISKGKKEKTKTKVQTKTAISKLAKTSKKTSSCKSSDASKDATFKILKTPRKPVSPDRRTKTSDKNAVKKVNRIIKVTIGNANVSDKQSSCKHLKNIVKKTIKIVPLKKIAAEKKITDKIKGKEAKIRKQPKAKEGNPPIVKPRKKYVRRKCERKEYHKGQKSEDKTEIQTKQEQIAEIEKQNELLKIKIKEEKPDDFEFPVSIKTEIDIDDNIDLKSLQDSAKQTIVENDKEAGKQEKKKPKNRRDKINKQVGSKKQTVKKPISLKKKTLVNKKVKKQLDDKRRAKLLQFWNSPKRHRVASLNTIAKVHCLYENESKAAFDKMAENSMIIKKEPATKSGENEKDRQRSRTRESDKEFFSDSDSDSDIPVTRTLRDVPGLRAIGKHWDMHDSISSDNNSDVEIRKVPKKVVKIKKETVPKKVDKNQYSKKPIREKKTRQRKEKKQDVFMDLKDMVVKKRMASLNASAILAASYSSDKRTSRTSRSPDSSSYDSDSSAEEYFAADDHIDLTKDIKGDVKEEDNLIEVHTTPNKKVAVIVNQDTDVTITGVYVNSTTRSTHHEGYCSIAGMQYRISATSHTQTAATAVATETLLQSSSSSDNANSDGQLSCSSKSYTPLEALSTMQPPPGPGIHNTPTGHHGMPCQSMPTHQLGSPQHRQQKSSSAFSPPHHGPPGYPPPPSQGHPPQGYPPPPPLPLNQGGPSPVESPAGYVHGYYQPAGPLISMTHTHGQQPMQQPPLTKSVPLSDTSPSSVTSPIHLPHPPPAPSSNNGDSSDNEVIITSVTAGTKEPPHPSPHQPPPTYRYSQYSQYPYAAYQPQYHYPTPPPPNPPYAHHEMCYPVAPPAGYVRHAKYAAPSTAYHRYPSYYPSHGSEMYPPSSAPTAQPSQQVVTASPVSSNGSYPLAPTGPPPPPNIMETYPPPPAPPTLVDSYQPPPHYYQSTYGLPPTCYSHAPSRAISYINAAYQPCPCPLNTCPKNGHTGPLTGEGKRPNISKDSMPLPPVALALPLEPASATGPPSPARGSAGMPSGGMPPPPSPAGASYQTPAAPTPKQESPSPEAPECKVEKRKARVGKAMVRSNMQNTMLLMCNPPQDFVKREIESPKDKEELHKKECEGIEEPTKVPALNEVGTILCTKEHCEVSINPTQKDILNIDELKTIKTVLMENLTEQPEESKEYREETLSTRMPTPPPEEEPLPPCIATVAENVKVKNMKRKQSLSKEQVPDVIVPPPTKKKKSSYKDFIRKHTSCFKISNGKRKLVSKTANRTQLSKIKLKTPTKKKLNASKEQTNNRRIKNDKTPLKESNGSAQKQSSKKTINVTSNLKKEGFKKKSKSNAVIKSAARILDNLIAKNNVDKVIEEVICKSMRTVCDVTSIKCKNKEDKKLGAKITKLVKSECKKIGASRRKSTPKCRDEVVMELAAKIPRKLNPLPRWSNGWRWEGDAYEGRVFLNSDETTVVRKCYPGMRHQEGDIIRPGHCVLLKAGPRKNDLPYVAKIAALWENPEDGEMMMALLWYYRPEHTEQGRLPTDQTDEVFASRHKDSNSVACIDDKCYVLTFNEYCRYKKEFKRREEGLEAKPICMSFPENYPRINRQPPLSNISPDMVFFCRKVYDFRQKRIIKNPA